ncbi:hypothetical protein TNCV_2318021 [Trichonephila clavipes]|nr:hypothetical protein TNCV_2318021 [Trichonephila clavipes]
MNKTTNKWNFFDKVKLFCASASELENYPVLSSNSDNLLMGKWMTFPRIVVMVRREREVRKRGSVSPLDFRESYRFNLKHRKRKCWNIENTAFPSQSFSLHGNNYQRSYELQREHYGVDKNSSRNKHVPFLKFSLDFWLHGDVFGD